MREDTYELCYNSACLSLGQSDVEVAQQKLRRAEGKLTNSSLCNILNVHIMHILYTCFGHTCKGNNNILPVYRFYIVRNNSLPLDTKFMKLSATNFTNF